MLRSMMQVYAVGSREAAELIKRLLTPHWSPNTR
jgi:hypothetical protein